jgi:hypothetical protein
VIVAPADVKAPDSVLRDAQRKNIEVLQAEMNVLDPTLKAAQEQFPQHFVNGQAEGVRDSRGKMLPKASFVVEIPPADPSGLMGSTAARPSPDPSAIEAVPTDQPTNSRPKPPSPGTGRLKSIDNK